MFIIFTPKKMHYQPYKKAPLEKFQNLRNQRIREAPFWKVVRPNDHYAFDEGCVCTVYVCV